MQNDLSSQSTAEQTQPTTTLLSRNAHSWFFWLATLCLAILLLSRPASLSASSIKINRQAQAPRVSPNVEMPIPDRDQEILIPADGQCLYKSIIVGYLLPNAHDADMFRIRLAMLVGEDKVICTEEVKSDKGDENKDDSKVDSSEQLDADLLRFTFLHLRRKDLLDCLRQPYPFTKLVQDMQQHMGIKNKLWGGIEEIQTIANHLQVTIQEYTPNPDNTKKLTEPDCFVPQNTNSLMTLCIVRDNPTKEEAVNPFADKDTQQAQANSREDSQHRQHYRSLLPMIPDFLIHTSQSSYSLPSSYRKNKPKLLLQSRSLPYSTKIKDVTGLEHMKEQKDAVSCANMIKKGIDKTDRKLIFKGLQLLKKIKIDHVSNPRRVMEILLDTLTSTAAEWESYGIKRHIAKTMRRFVYSMYLVGKKQNKRIHTDDKEKLLNRIKKALDLINESNTLGNGLRFELDVVEAMLKAMPDTTKKTDRWKNSVMTTIEAVKDKDPKKLLAVLQNIYQELKEQQSKNWYEIVLYINYLQEEATKNLETLGQLQYLLYFYKQPRWGQTKESSPSKLKLTFQNSAAKMNPTNPGGDWHILYAGIEALTYIVQHAVGSKRQQIIKQALESMDKEQPGLAYYFSFSKLKKLGIEYNNWRIREKAIESAKTLAKHNNNKIVQQKAKQFLFQHKHNKKEDKRIKLLFSKNPDKVIPIDNILEKEDFTQYKEGVNKLINDQTQTITQKLEKSDEKILQSLKTQKKDLENIVIDRLNQVQKKEGLIDSQSLVDIDLQDDLKIIAGTVQDDDPVLLLAILTNQPRDHKASFAQPQSASKLSFAKTSKGAQAPYYKKYIFSRQGILHHKAHRAANQLQCHRAQTRPAHIIVTLLEWIEKNPEKYVYSLAISVPICYKCQYLLTAVIGYTDHVKAHEKGCLGAFFAWPMPSFAMHYLDRFIVNSKHPFQVSQTILGQLLGISQSTYQALESQYDNTVQALKQNESLVNELNIKLNQKAEETENDKQNLVNQLNIQINQLTDQVNEKESELNTFKDETKIKLNDTTNELNKLKEEINKKLEEAQRLTDQLRKKESELNSTAKELKTANTNNTNLINQNSNLINQNTNLINQLNNKDEMIESNKKIIEDKDKELKDTEDKLQTANDDNTDLRSQIETKDKTIKEKIEEAQLLNDQLINKESDLNKTAKELENTKEELQTANNNNTNLVDQLNNKDEVIKNNKKIIEDKDKELKDTEDKLQTANDDNTDLRSQIETKNKTIKEKIEEAQRLNDQLSNKESELNKTAKELEDIQEKLQTANDDNNDLRSQIETKDKTIKEKIEEAQLLNDQLSKQESELNKTAKELENTQDEHKIEHEKTQQLIQQLKKQLEDKDNECNKLNEELKKKVKELQNFKYPKKKYKGKALPKDLSNQNLMGYDFTGCAFTYTNLTDTKLENTILANTTCDYQQAFQDHLKENKCEGGNGYQTNLPKDLKSIAQVYPRLKNHADKVKLLHIACGLSRLPFYTSTEFYIKLQYWSCELLQLTKKLGDPYGKQIVCSYDEYLNDEVEYYCWSTEYPQNDVKLDEKNPHADFAKYLTHFNNGLVNYKCKSISNHGFNWYKGNIEKNIKGLQKAYPKIESKELQKEACQIGCALSKSYQIRGMLLLFHYLFYQNRLIRLKNSVGIMVKTDIHYNAMDDMDQGLESW